MDKENKNEDDLGCMSVIVVVFVLFIIPIAYIIQSASIDAKLDDILKQQWEIIENIKYIKRSIKNDTMVYKDEI